MNTNYKKQSTVNNVTNSKNETITIRTCETLGARSIRRNAQFVQKVLDASPDAIISVTRLNNIVTVTADRDTIVKLRCALPVRTVESCSVPK